MNRVCKRILLIVLPIIFFSIFSCREEKKLFQLLPPSQTGINFENRLTPSADLNILTYLYFYNGAGVSIADVNNDLLPDIYFTSNQASDKLYLNKGNLVFEDITKVSGISNEDGWTTGVTHVDINHDGLLDIYVCKVSGYRTLTGRNLLFVNQGLGQNGVPVFKEDAARFHLDISTLATQSAFFDYDLDGDLDLFLLTHSVHPNRSYGRGQNRLLKDSLTGDRMFENRDDVFVEVSDRVNIFQSKIGYGLGLAVGDLDLNGYPDVYVGNDFFENDYCYLNNGGSFEEVISRNSEFFGHTSHYSMGNCLADLNNDGRIDLLSLDMLPEDLTTLKSSGVEDGFPIYSQYLRQGYAPQFMQNTLHVNHQNGFKEIGFFAGIAATEWSWSVLAADFDMDGWRDVYITNGIPGATNDMDYVSFISQEHVQRRTVNEQDFNLRFAEKVPEKKVVNYSFRNNHDLTFKNVSSDWFNDSPSFSNGAAYADLDNDGDLDLVVNNINEPAFVYENLSDEVSDSHYVKVKLEGIGKNRYGVGAKVEFFAGNLFIFEEVSPVKSYLSSVPCDLTIGIGQVSKFDSIRVTWPDGTIQRLYAIAADTSLIIRQVATAPAVSAKAPQVSYLSNSNISIGFGHDDQPSLDFDRDPLVPFALSNEGPSVSVADVNADGLQDFFIGGGKMQAGELLIQKPGGRFEKADSTEFQKSARSEDVDQCFFDADGDGDQDLIVVSGGNEFTGGEPLQPRLYLNTKGSLILVEAFKGVAVNASVVRTADLDKDGDEDIVIGSNAQPGAFGEPSRNFVFSNNGQGSFTQAKGFNETFAGAGLINDLALVDIDRNGYVDLVAVGDWMPLKIFLNNGSGFKATEIPDTEGWWNTVATEDFDRDGDIDLLAGNWGKNTRLTASKEKPVRLHRLDADNNGTIETLITYYYGGKQTLLASRDELTRQVPSIKKKFLSYKAFAEANLSDIVNFDESRLSREVKTLSSCYFKNQGDNTFQLIELPAQVQWSSVNALSIDDFNSDGFADVLLAGNDYELSTQLGRLDASHGVLLLNDRKSFFTIADNQLLDIAGPARDIAKILIDGKTHYVVTINNGKPFFLQKLK